MNLKRVRYFTGQVLGVDDLEAEQNYHLNKCRRHNRSLHGWGVVWGLGVSVNKPQQVITVDPGLALDCQGNELELENPATLPLPTSTERQILVAILYKECPTDPVPVPGGPAESEVPRTVPSRILETVEVLLDKSERPAPHKCLPGQLTCGEAHPVSIARLKRTAGSWNLDKNFAIPRCKHR